MLRQLYFHTRPSSLEVKNLDSCTPSFYLDKIPAAFHRDSDPPLYSPPLYNCLVQILEGPRAQTVSCSCHHSCYVTLDKLLNSSVPSILI